MATRINARKIEKDLVEAGSVNKLISHKSLKPKDFADHHDRILKHSLSTLQLYYELLMSQIPGLTWVKFDRNNFQRLTCLSDRTINKHLKQLQELYFIQKTGVEDVFYINSVMMCLVNNINKP